MYYSSLIPAEKVKYIFDSDKGKVGKYIGGIDVPVRQFDVGLANDCGVLIIFASSYNDEIISMLLDKGYSGRIVYFDRDRVMTKELTR